MIDDFRRAPKEFMYGLQSGSLPEELVLITSTLHLVRRFTFSSEAPLEGLFTEVPVTLLEPLDLLSFFKPYE